MAILVYAAVMYSALAAFPSTALRSLKVKSQERIAIRVSLSLGVL